MIVVFGAIEVIWPNSVSPVAPHIPELLGVVMFLMGLSLKVEDLRVLKSAPYSVLIAVVAQYLIMPLLGYGIAIYLNLEPLLVAGLVVLGSVPGGASSNIVAYLAGGNVALSVAATSVSTILAPLLSPVLVLWLVDSRVEVDAGAMVTQILKIVLVPVFLGVVVQLVLRQVVERLPPVVPWLFSCSSCCSYCRNYVRLFRHDSSIRFDRGDCGNDPQRIGFFVLASSQRNWQGCRSVNDA